MRKLLKQTLALATSVAMCLSMASPVLTVYAEDATVPTADSYVDAGDTADVSPFDSIAAPDTSDTEAADTETADTESADTEAADTETADAETTDTESADTETADAETTDTETADTEPAEPEPEAQPAEPATPETAAEPLTVLNPENPVTAANVGDTVTLSVDLNREDVQVTYQWQVLRQPSNSDTDAEPIYNYAEASTTDISKATKPTTFEENRQAAQQGGEVAGIARKALESRTGKPVITEKNAADLQQLVTDIVIDAAELPESKQQPFNCTKISYS